MSDLQKFKAKICFTAAGCLIYKNKVLLVKHKKVGFWLNPGGHVDPDETPDRAAEREFWEETGVKVRAVNNGEVRHSNRSQSLPAPYASNLHWVCRDNYETRVNGKKLTNYAKKHWQNGCEQHFHLMYLVEPVKGVSFKQNVEETDGIAWFTEDELDDLETTDRVRSEIKRAFELAG